MPHYIVIREHHYGVEANSHAEANELVERAEINDELCESRITYPTIRPIDSDQGIEDELLARPVIRKSTGQGGEMSNLSLAEALASRT